ncbi:MAG: radical SAM protein [Magnetococcales bacterium]|nr:radical SAM protein [Magnetococcales bacterium]
MLSYQEPLYRPPSEGNNLILQATLGCSNNRCTFCTMYRSKRFQIRPLDALLEEVDHAAVLWPDARRIFVADGDALVMPMDHWRPLLERLAQRFPRLQRVSCYARPGNLLKKTLGELAELRTLKLSLLYYGIESGYDPLLAIIEKGEGCDRMCEGLLKAAEAGLKVSATVVLGLGGTGLWKAHIDGTIELIHRVPLHYLSTLQLMMDPSLESHFIGRFPGGFQFQDDNAILDEQHRLLAGIIQPPRPIIFRSNHASNALALAGNLPRDQQRLLGEIDAARGDGEGVRPFWMRGL